MECPLDGDCSDCSNCAYSSDYWYNPKTGECELREDVYERVKGGK
jgi:hypothetical protein